MTAAPQPLGRLSAIAEHVIRALAWGTQAAAGVAYLAVTVQPAAWRTVLDRDPVGVVFMWVFSATMAWLWAVSLVAESKYFYDRRAQRLARRAGLIGHLSVLLIAALAAAGLPNRIGWWAVLAAVAFAAVATWVSWMESRFLPDEDQAVVDTILSREAAERAAVYNAGEKKRRRERLTAIVERLGYKITDRPVQDAKPAEAPAVRWKIPGGKHAPFVYFIRNGNRMKIGTTTDLKRRIRTLALRPDNVALLVNGDHRVEREYHKQFAALRIGSTEWFAYEGALVDYVHTQTARLTQKGQEQ